MLPEQKTGDQDQPEPVDPPRPVQEPCHGPAQHGHRMKQPGYLKRSRFSEFRGHGEKPSSLIEILVLKSIDHVKPRDPERHARGQEARRPSQGSPACDPGAIRRDPED